MVCDSVHELADMVHLTPDFPRPNIVFHHVIGISQQSGGLELCTSLLKRHFLDNWRNVAAIACCEAGGIVFASVLALQVNVPLMLIREDGKLPPPIYSALKSKSHISSIVCIRKGPTQHNCFLHPKILLRRSTVILLNCAIWVRFIPLS